MSQIGHIPKGGNSAIQQFNNMTHMTQMTFTTIMTFLKFRLIFTYSYKHACNKAFDQNVF